MLFLSCSDDEEDLSNNPSDFTITMDTIAFNLASISWERPLGNNNANLTYKVWLNNNQVATTATNERTFTFQSLEENTNYDIKISGSNDIGEAISEINFKTLNPSDHTFLLKTHKTRERIYFYEYDTSGYLTRRTDSVFCICSNFIVTYSNNESGKLINEVFTVVNDYMGAAALFTYDDDEIIDFRYVSNFNVYEFDFVDSNHYSVTLIPDSFPDKFYYEVTLGKTNGLITSYEIMDLDTQNIINKGSFAYENGNVVKVINELNGDEIDIEYDEKKNYYIKQGFLTKSGPSNQPAPIASGQRFSFIPEFVDYANTNNITKVYKNGEVIVENIYEYNSYDYPIKITYIDGTVEELTYTYF